jgi:class 3 adenylate cyclase
MGGLQPDDELRRALIEAQLLQSDGPSSEDRFEAFKLLVELGASVKDLQEYQAELGLLATRLSLLGLPTLTLRQLADRAGVSLKLVEQLWLAGGIPDPGADVPSAVESDITVVQTFLAGSEIYGEEIALHLARVIGTATARIADALVSLFVSRLDPQVAEADSSVLSLIRANIAQTDLFPALMSAIEQGLRRHIIQSARPPLSTVTVGYEVQTLAVGFADLVGSTELARSLDFADLCSILREFEGTAADIVVRHRGRVVKLIGDEIMFTAGDATGAVAAAANLIEAFRNHPHLPPARAGLAFGQVLTREGDCFGPVVNLAARVVSLADADSVLADTALVSQLSTMEWTVREEGSKELRGFDAPVPVFRVMGAIRRPQLGRS